MNIIGSHKDLPPKKNPHTMPRRKKREALLAHHGARAPALPPSGSGVGNKKRLHVVAMALQGINPSAHFQVVNNVGTVAKDGFCLGLEYYKTNKMYDDMQPVFAIASLQVAPHMQGCNIIQQIIDTIAFMWPVECMKVVHGKISGVDDWIAWAQSAGLCNQSHVFIGKRA